MRIKLLQAVASLGLPDCYVAAGFVRNAVWDYLHNYTGTALSDIDVVYYSKKEIDETYFLEALKSIMPGCNWQIKNQAFMHHRYSDAPYLNTSHAMEYWPEIETSVGARMTDDEQIEVVAPFGVESLFAGYITRNPNRSSHIFSERVRTKGWLEKWPKLKVVL